MRLIEADAFEVYGTTVPDGMDAEAYMAGACEVLEKIDAMPTVDAIPVDESVCKISRGDFIVYRREWLYVHLEQEFEILKEVRGWAERKEE